MFFVSIKIEVGNFYQGMDVLVYLKPCLYQLNMGAHTFLDLFQDLRCYSFNGSQCVRRRGIYDDIVNLEINQPRQSFGGTYRAGVCARIFIGACVHLFKCMCM